MKRRGGWREGEKKKGSGKEEGEGARKWVRGNEGRWNEGRGNVAVGEGEKESILKINLTCLKRILLHSVAGVKDSNVVL